MSDDEEDYDLSNQVLNSYLYQIGGQNLDLNLEPRLGEVLCEPDISEPSESEHQENFPQPSIFYDPNQIDHFLNITDPVLLDFDKQFLLNMHLNLLDQVNVQSRFELVKRLVNTNKPVTLMGFLLYLLIIVITKSILFSLIYLIAAMSLVGAYFWIEINVKRAFVNDSTQLLSSYLKQVNKLVYFLKECELVSLSNRRQVAIEKKLGVASKNCQDLDDTLNYSFRRLVFKRLRVYFFALKQLNVKQVNRINFKSINKLHMTAMELDRSSFICCMDGTELAEVLVENDEKLLNKQTDHFSLKCIKSLSRLIEILASEHFKLLQINELASHGGSIASLVESYSANTRFKRMKTDSQRLLDICQIIAGGDNSNQQDLIKQNPNLEHVLATHLRNALLITLKLNKINQTENRIETLCCLKNSFEYCELYMKQLVDKVEGNQVAVNRPTEIELVSKVNINYDLILSDEQVCQSVHEDEIYEADTSKPIEESKPMPSQIELESHMKEKEVYLANRNLFYELQFALKSKRNEWNERERKAKRATDQTVDDNANLLENEILKYKSGLRRRRRTNNTSAECNSIATPADSSDMNELYSETNNSILAEFMMKRTKLFVEDDEVLYE